MPTPNGPEKITYQGKIIEVVEQPMKIGDRVINFESARRAPGTRIILPTKDGKIILTKEFRVETSGYDYRLPGGKVFDTLTEYVEFKNGGGDIKLAAEKAATKEGLEEVGATIEKLELFGISKCGATVEWDLYYYIALDFSLGERKDSGEGEDITSIPIHAEEVKKMCLDGRIQEERSALMLLRYLNK